MARPRKEGNTTLLTFVETQNYIQGSIGAKMASLSKMIKEDTRSRRESTLLTDLGTFCEYLEMNPYEIVEYVRKAMADRELLPEARARLEDYPKWLISEKHAVETSANTKYGNARGFLKHNNVRITLKNYSPKTEKAKKMEENAIKFEDLFEIARKMYLIADFEMKAWMSIDLNSGLRNSDMVRLPLKELKAKLDKNSEFLEITHPAWKQSNEKITYLAILHRLSQINARNYLETIKDDREFLFGGKKDDTDALFDKLERNISNKIRTLYMNVAPDDLKELNLVTPHTFRALFETILGNHGINKDRIKRMDGHMPDNLEVYDLPTNVFEQYIKTSEKDLNFEHVDLSMETKEEIQLDTLKKLNDLLNNQGKLETLFHRVSELGEDDSEIAPEDKIEIEMADFIDKMYVSFENRLIKKFGLQVI